MKKLIKKLKRLKSWFPIIWKDEGAEILDRIIKNDYNSIGFLRHELSWDTTKFEGYDIHWGAFWGITDQELKNVEKKEFLECCKKEKKERQADIDKLFKMV